LDQKLKRLIIVIPFVVISSVIGARIILEIVSPSFSVDFDTLSTRELDEGHGVVPENYTFLGIDHINDDCCGHTDSTPPTIDLNVSLGWNRFYNNSINRGGTTIDLLLADDNPIDDNLPTGVSYHWDSQSNTTLTFPYNVILPIGDGPHLLYVYAKDGSNNWASAVFRFVVGIPPPAISLNSLQNETTILNGTTIDLDVDDGLYSINQVLYHWDTDQSNTTSDYPYNAVPPIDNGTCQLTIYAENEIGNWTSAVFIFTVTTDPSLIVQPTTTTGLGRRTDGYLLLPTCLMLVGLVVIRIKQIRKKRI
jgi:hypothetical protein